MHSLKKGKRKLEVEGKGYALKPKVLLPTWKNDVDYITFLNDYFMWISKTCMSLKFVTTLNCRILEDDVDDKVDGP